MLPSLFTHALQMGLGKTVQVMSLIAYLMEKKQNFGPHLIIVPNAGGQWGRSMCALRMRGCAACSSGTAWLFVSRPCPPATSLRTHPPLRPTPLPAPPVIVNWKSELTQWLPAARCVYYVGNKVGICGHPLPCCLLFYAMHCLAVAS